MKIKHLYSIGLLVLGLFVTMPTLAHSCHSSEKVVAFFAHPDDETWISGALAKHAANGDKVYLVYATSGAAGRDLSGKGLEGAALATERENEAKAAALKLGVYQQVIFLKFDDGKLADMQPALTGAFSAVVEQIGADRVISFGLDGVTGHDDHKQVAIAAQAAVNTAKKTVKYYQFAVSESRQKLAAQISRQQQHPYLIRAPIADYKITEKLDVSEFKSHRLAAFSVHKTQFPESIQQLWQTFVEQVPYEEWVKVQ